jgi:hypothetical protein
MRENSMHSVYQNNLCLKLEKEYDYIETNVCLFSIKGQKLGEIDVIAHKDDYCDIYEVKCSYRVVKAKKQLKKIKEILGEVSFFKGKSYLKYDDNHIAYNNEFPRIRKVFFYCGESESISDLDV